MTVTDSHSQSSVGHFLWHNFEKLKNGIYHLRLIPSNLGYMAERLQSKLSLPVKKRPPNATKIAKTEIEIKG